MKSKSKSLPTEKRADNRSYLKANDNTEAKRVVELCRDLPHLQKPPKMMLK